MKYFQRGAGFLILLAFVISPTMLLAQNDESINVAGSGIVAPLFEALSAASEVEIDVNLTVTGTSRGIADLCDGTVDVAMANRPISVDEDANCIANEIEYIELLLGHNILAFITHPDVDFTQCLTTDVIQNIFSPSAAGQVTNWMQLDAMYPETSLSVFTPQDNTAVYAILDRLTGGDGLRGDATTGETNADIVAGVSETPGALGVVNLATAITAGDSINILEVHGSEVAGCSLPSSANVENRLYTVADRLFVYANANNLETANVQDLLTYISGSESTATVESLGFTAPTDNTYETNLAVIEDSEIGRQFSQEVVTFDIPANVAGQIIIGGAAHIHSYLQDVATGFSGLYAGSNVEFTVEGQSAGFRRLCNGELDIAMAYDDMTTEQLENCEANNINVETLNIGTQAVVLVANAEDEFTACLTTEQLTTVWGAESTETTDNWNQVDDSFPDLDMTLFAPNAGNTYTALLFAQNEGPVDPARSDTETHHDVLYRAAATANVPGALAYMSWNDYQRVLENEQANIQLVAVDAGTDCITPNAETIADGSYPLSRTAHLVLSQPSLSRVDVQAFLWYLMSDENYPLLEESEFIGIDFSALPEIRSTLQTSFVLAEEAAAIAQEMAEEAEAEATSEPEAETTDEPENDE